MSSVHFTPMTLFCREKCVFAREKLKLSGEFLKEELEEEEGGRKYLPRSSKHFGGLS